MGVLYIVSGIAFAGITTELLAAIFGDSEVGDYEYHFASGVGAVFGNRG